MKTMYFYYSANQEQVIKRTCGGMIPPQRYTLCFFKGKQYTSAHRRCDRLARFDDNVFIGIGTFDDCSYQNA